ncbi:MAG: hypothetical protein U1F11_06050 [Steroidobacteraceae bacterium]
MSPLVRSSLRRSYWFAGLLLMAGPMAHAQSWVVTPRLTAGQQDFNFRYFDLIQALNTNLAGTRDGFEVGDRVSFVGAGLTVSHGRWFLDLSGQQTSTGNTTTTQFIGPIIGLPGNGANHDLFVPFSRKELNAAIGYGINPNLSVFVGYKDARTKLRNNLSPILDQVQIGNLYLIGQQTNRFSYKGEFAGLSYSAPVDRWNGAFGFQASLAQLHGKIESNFDFPVFISVATAPFLVPVNPAVFGLTTIDPARGRSLGMNLGISWTGHFDWISPRLSKMSYTIGVDRSEYNFKERTRTNDFSETITRVRLDLRYAIGIGKDTGG